jgi:hypothetical protein
MADAGRAGQARLRHVEAVENWIDATTRRY